MLFLHLPDVVHVLNCFLGVVSEATATDFDVFEGRRNGLAFPVRVGGLAVPLRYLRNSDVFLSVGRKLLDLVHYGIALDLLRMGLCVLWMCLYLGQIAVRKRTVVLPGLAVEPSPSRADIGEDRRILIHWRQQWVVILVRRKCTRLVIRAAIVLDCLQLLSRVHG